MIKPFLVIITMYMVYVVQNLIGKILTIFHLFYCPINILIAKTCVDIVKCGLLKYCSSNLPYAYLSIFSSIKIMHHMV